MPSSDTKVLNRVVDEIQDFGHFATVFIGASIEYLMRGGLCGWKLVIFPVAICYKYIVHCSTFYEFQLINEHCQFYVF